MTMLVSQKLYKILSFTVNTAYFFRTIPFRWDCNTNLLQFGDGYFSSSTSVKFIWKFQAWHFVKSFYMFYFIFLIAGLFRLIYEKTENYRLYYNQVLTIILFALLCMIQIWITVYNSNALMFLNQCLTFFRTIDGK